MVTAFVSKSVLLDSPRKVRGKGTDAKRRRILPVTSSLFTDVMVQCFVERRSTAHGIVDPQCACRLDLRRGNTSFAVSETHHFFFYLYPFPSVFLVLSSVVVVGVVVLSFLRRLWGCF